MPHRFIKFEETDSIAIITLNRPDNLNSFNMIMAKEVQDAFDECAQRKTVRCVLLTGEGRGFCAGQDLQEAMGDKAPAMKEIVEKTYNPIILKIRNIEKPVVCAVNGVAAGAGANIALACDITVATESASFIQAFSKIGLVPDSGGTYILPRLIGMQRSAALMMLGEKVKAKEAEALGMIWKSFSDDSFQMEVMKLCKTLAAMPTRGLGLTKKLLNSSFDNSLNAQLVAERDLQEEAGATYDFKEGVQAFIQKRPPQFKGE